MHQVVVAASVPPELAAAVHEVARANDRSFSAEVRCALRAYIGSTKSDAQVGDPGGAMTAWQGRRVSSA